MSWPDAFFYPHEVTIQNLVTTGGLGDVYADPRTVAAEVRDEQKLVRTADATEVVSSTQVTVKPATDVAPGALVTVWAGTTAERTARVLDVGRHVNEPPLTSHLVLSLE